MSDPVGTTIKLRRDTTANWAAANPILQLAEPGLNTDLNALKYGDGVTPWNDLPYQGVIPEQLGNLIPEFGNTYNLGNASNPWLSLYLSGNTIYLGNIVLESAGNALTVDGNALVTTGGNVTFNDISATGNVDVAGSVSVTANVYGGNVLTDNLLYANGSPWDLQQAAGNNNEIQFNEGDNFAASSNFTFDPGSNVLTVTGTSSTTGNVIAGNVRTSGQVSASGNVTANTFIGSGTALTGVVADRGSDLNNWNSMTQMGVYTVNRASWSGTSNTPLDSQVFVGLVEVLNSTGTALTQVYYPGTVEPGNVKVQWNRTYWSGSWSSWIKIVNDDQVVVGGNY